MKLTRRYFLQGIGASAVLGTLTGLAPTKALAMNSYGANTSLLAKRAGTIKYSSCLRNCADRCLMKFSVQNGRMTYVRGADEQYKTGSCPCVKGLTYVEYTYAPDRILHPMVRVGEKGSHKWRRITWEEAWDILIKKTNEVIEQYGSEAILRIPIQATTVLSVCAAPTVSSTASVLPFWIAWFVRKQVSGATAACRVPLTVLTPKPSPTATATYPGALMKQSLMFTALS